MSNVKTAPKMTPSQRKALAAKVAKAREAGATGDQLREQFGEWLTGPVRRTLLREHGHGHLVAKSYDRQEARVKREARMAEMAKASEAKPKRTRKPKTAEVAVPTADQAS